MGAALTSLFGRDFLVGYFLPGLAAIVLGLVMLLMLPSSPMGLDSVAVLIKSASTALSSHPQQSNLSDTLLYAAIAVLLLAALFGLVLSSANTAIFRFFEGYGAANPLRLLIKLERRRHTRALDRIEQIEEALTRTSDEKDALTARYGTTLRRFVAQFPEDIDHVLPTRLGNTIRAFETYPRIMYGLEGIQGWPRLLTVVPKDYYFFVAASKTQVDLCLNIVVACWLLLIEYAAINGRSFGTTVQAYEYPWIAAALAVASLLFLRAASSAAISWGEWVKASFDVYQEDLKGKLKFVEFEGASSEQEKWKGFSEAIVYRRPDRLIHRIPAPKAPAASPWSRLIAYLASKTIV